MQALIDMWNQIDPNLRTFLPFIAVGLIGYIIFIIWYMKKQKNQVASFKAKHPDFATVLIKTKGMTHSLTVESVDGKAPVLFNQGMTPAFVVTPGSHIVESTFTTTRPGVMHKSVTKVYGPTKQEIFVETGKTYHYSFDPQTEAYEFTAQSAE